MHKLNLKIAVFFILCAFSHAFAAPLDDAAKAFESGRYTEAKSLLEPLAANGVTAAKRMLGEMYYGGKGVPLDKATAVQWTASAAADGDRLAEFSMGYLYENGDGVARSEKKAIDYYQKSALQKYVPAMVKTGDLLRYSDKQTAMYWYKTASEYGDEESRKKYTRLADSEAAATYASNQKLESERKSECANACSVAAERTRCELKMMEPSMCSDPAAQVVQVEVNVTDNNRSAGINPNVFRELPNINPRTNRLGVVPALPAVNSHSNNSRLPNPATATKGNVGSIASNQNYGGQQSNSNLQSPHVDQVAPSQAQAPRQNASPQRYTCNTHRIFRQFATGKTTEEQACAQAKRQADAFVGGFGRDTVVGQDTSSLQSVESCKLVGESGVSYKTAEVRVNYSEIRLNACGESSRGMSK